MEGVGVRLNGENSMGVARVGGGDNGWLGLETTLPLLLLDPLITL